MARVLLVDDDIELCEMLAEYLAPEGFEVDTAHDGEQGARQAVAGRYDAVVLDVMLPRVNGLVAAHRHESQIPVLMLTAKGDEWTGSWVWSWARTITWRSPSTP
jgi:DNA-binding response OmpR family regulator